VFASTAAYSCLVAAASASTKVLRSLVSPIAAAEDATDDGGTVAGGGGGVAAGWQSGA